MITTTNTYSTHGNQPCMLPALTSGQVHFVNRPLFHGHGNVRQFTGRLFTNTFSFAEAIVANER